MSNCLKSNFALLMSLGIIFGQKEYLSNEIFFGSNRDLNDRWFEKQSLRIVNGNVYTYYGSTRMLNGYVIAGFKTGTWKQWYANGMIKCIDQYKYGKRNGLQKCWHDNGKIKSEEIVKSDTLFDYKKEFYFNGKLKQHNVFRNGILVNSTRWDSLGNKILD